MMMFDGVVRMKPKGQKLTWRDFVICFYKVASENEQGCVTARGIMFESKQVRRCEEPFEMEGRGKIEALLFGQTALCVSFAHSFIHDLRCAPPRGFSCWRLA